MILARLGTTALTALLLAAPVAQAAISTFDSDAEGWTAQGDFESPLTWSPTGGNPGGRVYIDDRTLGGVTYFVAPAAFLGDQLQALGTSLTFDLLQTYPGAANQFDAADVILTGGGVSLVFDTPMNPGLGTWTSYAVPLSAPGWRVGSLAGVAATPAQIAAVLSDITSLRIRAEYQTGADVGYLDNVALVPEPSTTGMLLLGIGGVAAMAGRRRMTRA